MNFNDKLCQKIKKCTKYLNPCNFSGKKFLVDFAAGSLIREIKFSPK